jgi:O-methyltransferase
MWTGALRWATAKRYALRELRDAKDAYRKLQSSYYLSGMQKKIDLCQLEGFSEIAGKVISEGRLGMNYDRLYTLWQAVQGAPPDLPIVEIGTYKGGSARFINETLRSMGRSPRYLVCDTFSGHARHDPSIDLPERSNGHNFRNTSAEEVARYLDAASIEIVKGDIVETASRLPEGPYGFVHIDVDVYPATSFCMRFFAPRLADGAVIVVDDYGFVTCPGAKRAVDEFVDEFPDYRLFHLLTGQAIVFRR